jgi:cardiolipin synthase (CMP-forming)
MTLPNALTLLRLFSIPLIVVLIHEHRFQAACWVFISAGITDALDGYLARKLNQQSQIGAYLDALADKSLIAASFITLHFEGMVPFWLLILVISRDLMIMGAVAIAWLLENPVPIEPLMVSKANTAAQIVLVGTTLAATGYALALPMQALPWLGYLVATLTILSVAAYFAGWFRHMAGGEAP